MKAEIKTEIKKKMIQVEEKEKVVVLTFTEKEAEVVKDLFGSVVGQNDTRKFTDKVFASLNKLKIGGSDFFIGEVSAVTIKNHFGEKQ